MKKTSAGLLMYRLNNGELEIFLAHPGGPYFLNKDQGYWGIPKGEVEDHEELLETAKREFWEETGIEPCGTLLPLGSVMLTSGKIVHAWAFETGQEKPALPESNLFLLEWPPHSGKQEWFPEIDQVDFFQVGVARQKINSAQAEFIIRLENYLRAQSG